MSTTRYASKRIAQAAVPRAVDATFSRAGSTLASLAQRGLSLIAGRDVAGWAIGLDGSTVRELPTETGEIMSTISTNEIVYACMRARTKALTTPTFVVERRQADGTFVPEDDHPLASLIRRPAENLDTASLWRCLEVSYSSVGTVYLEPLFGSQSGILTGVNPLNPAFIEERYDGYGRLEAYDWRPPQGQHLSFAPDELITRRSVAWADPPPLVVALGAANADQLANEFVAGFFGGGGIPSSIIWTKDQWDDERSTDFRGVWMQRFAPGTRLPAILGPAIAKYERLGVSLDELDNETIRQFIESRLCMPFEIPPLIIYAYCGLTRSTYSNLREAWDSFWDSTGLGLLRDWADWITWSLLTRYESPEAVMLGDVRCRFDVSMIGPYQEDINAKVSMLKEGYDLGAVKLNEYRAAMKLDPDPAGDVYKSQAPGAPVPIIPAEPDQGEGDQGEGDQGKAILILPAPKEVTV